VVALVHHRWRAVACDDNGIASFDLVVTSALTTAFAARRRSDLQRLAPLDLLALSVVGDAGQPAVWSDRAPVVDSLDEPRPAAHFDELPC